MAHIALIIQPLFLDIIGNNLLISVTKEYWLTKKSKENLPLQTKDGLLIKVTFIAMSMKQEKRGSFSVISVNSLRERQSLRR